ncbi:MAG: hypothetical protein JWO03_568 [Bacteroidetes bacterium]|nr:hypothetical protein [Bacteroidota bacterium]
MSAIKGFSLVGGTALSLRYGHRTSIDLDLFCHERFKNSDLVAELKKVFGKAFVYEGGDSKFGLFCYIDQVKVDIVYYPHLPIAPVTTEDTIRMYDSKDIVAMKVQAILGRGKKKDFWDVAELLQHFSVKQFIELHDQKFPDQMLLISIPQALTYYDDAEQSEDPVSLKGQTWESVKKTISQKVSDYLK